jgi:hypothetical protein
MTASAALLRSLDAISAETTAMLDVLDSPRGDVPDDSRREAKRRVLEIRARTQELFDWISEARLESPRN